MMTNLFMEDLEARVLGSSPDPLRIWLRFVDDTFIVHKAEPTQQFLSHLNTLDPTYNSQLRFRPTWHTSWTPCSLKPPMETLITTFYRNPTHTDQYLQWDSHHTVTNKYSVYNTLSHRAQYVCSNQQLLDQENQHIHMALSRCIYPDWVLHRLQTKMDCQLSKLQCHNNINPHRDTNKNSIFTVVPYSKELSESFGNICRKSRSIGPF